MLNHKKIGLLLAVVSIFTISLAPVAMGFVATPSNLSASAISDSSIKLTWKDNANNESYYRVYRYDPASSSLIIVASLLPDVETYTETGLTPDTIYQYAVDAVIDTAGLIVEVSTVSNVASARTGTTLVPVPAVPLGSVPVDPTNLTAAATDAGISLSWSDNASDELGYRAERQETGSSIWSIIGTLPADTQSFTDTAFTAGASYQYRVTAFNNYGDSQPSNIAAAAAPGTNPTPAAPGSIIMRFFLGNTQYTIDGVPHAMDVAPVEKQGRILLPIRYVVEPLGITPEWDGVSKATIQNSTTMIELWLGQNTARVNGADVFIDPANPDLVPVSLPPGRIMLPLRFVAENLGCTTNWDLTPPGSAVITYSKLPEAWAAGLQQGNYNLAK